MKILKKLFVVLIIIVVLAFGYKYYDYLNLDMSKITIDDLAYNDVIFIIEKNNNNCDIPVSLAIYKKFCIFLFLLSK